MISQPRIAVLGLSQLYVFMCLDDWLLVVVVLGFELYLRFKLRFKPSAYLYLKTSTKTRITILVFFLHYSITTLLFTRLLSFAWGLVSVYYYKGAKCLCTLCLYQEVSLCLYQEVSLCLYQEVSLCLVSQVTLRSSTFASSIVCLAKSHVFHHITHLPKSGVRL